MPIPADHAQRLVLNGRPVSPPLLFLGDRLPSNVVQKDRRDDDICFRRRVRKKQLASVQVRYRHMDIIETGVPVFARTQVNGVVNVFHQCMLPRLRGLCTCGTASLSNRCRVSPWVIMPSKGRWSSTPGTPPGHSATSRVRAHSPCSRRMAPYCTSDGCRSPTPNRPRVPRTCAALPPGHG